MARALLPTINALIAEGMMIDPPQIFSEIVTALRAMEAAAVPRSDGTLTGIRGYCDHVNPHRSDKRNIVENLWSEEIAGHFRSRGIPAKSQVRYPTFKGTCDLVVSFNDLQRIWIEVKGEWREEIAGSSCAKNKNYAKYIQATAEDVEKLNRLSDQHASHVGLLVIGFDRLAVPIEFEHLSPIMERMKAHEWTMRHECWDDRWFKGFRIQVWFWWRPLQPRIT